MNTQCYSSIQLIHQSDPTKTQSSTHNRSLPQSSNQLNKIIRSLEKHYTQQRIKRQNLQQQLIQTKKRAIGRELQLNSLIKKMKQSGDCIVQQAPQIANLFNKIWKSFDQYKIKTTQILQKNCQDNFQSMNRKIKNIMDCMNQQLTKKTKLNNQELLNIREDLRHLYEAAIKIQDKNIEMAKKVKQLQFQIKILTQQKFLILEDLLSKKTELNIIAQENIMLNQTLGKIRQTNPSSSSVTSQVKKIHTQQNPVNMRSQSRNKQKYLYQPKFKKTQVVQSQRQIQQQSKKSISRLSEKKPYSRHLNKNKSQLYQSILSNPQQFNYSKIDIKPGNFNANIYNTLLISKRNKLNNNKQTILGSTISYTARDNSQKIVPRQMSNARKNSSFVSARIKQQSTSICKIEQLQKYTNQAKVNFRKKQEGQCLKCPNCKIQTSIEDEVKKIKQKQYSYRKTIQNLQNTLKRQKNKNISLVMSLNKITNQSQQINESLQKIIAESLSNPTEDRIVAIAQSQKFFNLLKSLKQRLTNTQRPAVNCGWGDNFSDI